LYQKDIVAAICSAGTDCLIHGIHNRDTACSYRRKKNSGHMMPCAWKPAHAVLRDARKLRSILQQLVDIIEVATVCKCNGETYRTVQDVKRF
jgi:hypothetical protein